MADDSRKPGPSRSSDGDGRKRSGAKKPLKPGLVLNGHPLRQGHALYDPAAREELHERLGRISKLKTESDVDLWQQGDEFHHIKLRKLYRQAGFSGMTPWLFSIDRDPRAVSRLVTFSTRFSLEEVKTYGKEMLDLAHEYVLLTSGKKKKWSAGTLRVEVPGLATYVPFAKIELTQLRAAVDHQYELRERRRRDAIPEDVHDTTKHLSRSVTTEAGQLARIESRPSATGRPEDTMVVIEARHGDLASVLSRMLEALDPKRRGRG